VVSLWNVVNDEVIDVIVIYDPEEVLLLPFCSRFLDLRYLPFRKGSLVFQVQLIF